MKYKSFILKYFLAFKIFSVVFGTISMFWAFYFSSKPASFGILKESINNPMMYVCLLISFLTSLGMVHWIIKRKNFNN